MLNRGSSAFFGCSRLTSVTIPEGVTSIGGSSFEFCARLTSVTIPSSVTSIGDSTFGSCTGLTSVTIPSSVTSIGRHAFRSCTSLASITIPSSVTSIGDWTFSFCTSLTSVTIPEGVTSIGSSTFSDCHSLTSVTIPESVTSIGNFAFSRCSSLIGVIIPEGVTSIGSRAFLFCTSLTSVTIPVGITNIESATFRNCSSLSSVTIPEGVISIDIFAFSSCSRLTSVTIPSSVASIGLEAFSFCSLTSVTIPEGVINISSGAFRSNRLAAAVFLGDAPVGGLNPFSRTASGFTIYFLSGSSGFDLAPWDAYPATLLGLSIADVSVSENAVTAEAVISMSGPVTTGFRVDYATNSGTATAGSDFTASAGTAEIPEGQSRVSILIPITDDNLVEGNEMFTLTLSNSVGAGIVDGEATVIIEDNDVTALTVENAEVEESVGMAPVIVRHSNPLGTTPTPPGLWSSVLTSCIRVKELRRRTGNAGSARFVSLHGHSS